MSKMRREWSLLGICYREEELLDRGRVDSARGCSRGDISSSSLGVGPGCRVGV
jgi:hypothetical protein